MKTEKDSNPSATPRANRNNAAISTGPRTPDGKAVSSRNATKYGLSSAFRVLEPVDVCDVGVIERGEDLCFTLEATFLQQFRAAICC